MALALIKAIIIAEAIKQGFNPDIALAVAKVESNYNPNAIGRRGEVGLYQILPQFSQVPKSSLYDVRNNAREGIRQLKYWQGRCGDKFLACYNGGIDNKELTNYSNRVGREL